MSYARSLICRIFLWAFCLFFLQCQSAPDDLGLEGRVTRIRLANGMRFVLLPRPGAPTFAARLRVKVGSMDEEPGEEGLAHLFEHMAFKGTASIGSLDFAKEKPVLEAMLMKGSELVKARLEGGAQTVGDLKKQLEVLEEEHRLWFSSNAFLHTLQTNGAVQLNATTSYDFTYYQEMLPINKLELWAYLESERLKHGPVYREFFKEVDVILGERQTRVDNNPDGFLQETFLDFAFSKSPYKHHTLGTAEDILHHTPEKAQAFYEKHYTPDRIVGALVGDFSVAEVQAILEKYFGDIPARPTAYRRVEPEILQGLPKQKTITYPAAPRFWLGYFRVAFPNPDDTAFDFLQMLLCAGNHSLLHQKIVVEKKLALSLTCEEAMPGVRLPSYFVFVGMPQPNVTNAEVAQAIRKELETLMHEGIAEERMAATKAKIEAGFVYALASDAGMATRLSFYEAFASDWHSLYAYRKNLLALDAKALQKVLKTHFIPEHEVSVFLERETKP